MVGIPSPELLSRLSHRIYLYADEHASSSINQKVLFQNSATGQNFTALLINATEASNFNFEDQDICVTEKNIKLEIDLKQFFQYYRIINAKYLAARIGMNESLLSQYVKGHKKPSSSQTNRILSGVKEIGKELANIHHFTN